MSRLRSLLLLALVVLLATCGGDNFADALIGRWEGTSTNDSGTLPATWEFFEDGTAIITIDTAAGPSTFAGLYQFEDDDTIILLEQEGDTTPGRRDIRMPDDDTLILTAPVSGDQAVLKRATE